MATTKYTRTNRLGITTTVVLEENGTFTAISTNNLTGSTKTNAGWLYYESALRTARRMTEGK